MITGILTPVPQKSMPKAVLYQRLNKSISCIDYSSPVSDSPDKSKSSFYSM